MLPGDHRCPRGDVANSPPSTAIQDAAATILTAHVADPTGSAASSATRTIGSPASWSSRRDAEELEIDEINTSIYCFRRNLLARRCAV